MRASSRPSIRALAVLLTVALRSAPAASQTVPKVASAAPSPQDAAEALRRFKAGVKLYGEKAYAEALAEFEASYRLGGRASALRNVAQCQRDLRHFAEAYDAYDRLLRLHGGELSTADKDAVGHALTELSELSGTLSIQSSEAGAAVELDGAPLGTTPLAGPTRASLGLHRLRVTKAGFEPFEKDVTVASGGSVEVTATLAVEVTTGHVSVRETSGRSVHVFIDGHDEGPAPFEGDVPPGDHTLELKGPSFAADARPFSLARRQRLDLAADAQSTQGHVRITTLPATASIALDGQAVGTGAYDGDVAPGKHAIEVSLAGAPPVKREVSVERGQLVVQEIPVATGGIAVFKGFEGRIDFDFSVAPGSVDYRIPPKAPVVPIGTTGPFAGGATLRLGYAFDWYAVEFFGIFQLGHSDTEITGPAGSRMMADADIGKTFVKGIFGVAARATSKTDTLRVTGSLGVGLDIAQLFFDVSNFCNDPTAAHPCPGSFSASPGFVAPAFVGDVGILLGGTPPGAKLFLGVQAWVEVTPTLDVGPYPDASYLKKYEDAPNGWTAASGPTFFVGPVLGVGFGH